MPEDSVQRSNLQRSSMALGRYQNPEQRHGQLVAGGRAAVGLDPAAGEEDDGEDAAATPSGREECSMQMVDVKGFAGVLQALKSGAKQICAVTIAPDGLRVRWEDESKTLQCSVFLPAELFASYKCAAGVRHTFGLPLNVLLDTLNLFASAPTAEGLTLRYPGPNNELECGMSSGTALGQRCAVTTYARLGTVNLPECRDLTDFWQHPTSSFISQGGLLREVVEDIEWPQGDVQLTLCAEPQQRLSFRAGGDPGYVQVDVPVESLVDFTVLPALQPPGEDDAAGAYVEHSYKYKALKAAFCDLLMAKGGASGGAGGAGAGGGGGASMRGGGEGGGAQLKVHEASTKVFVDANGMLKVTHMVAMAPDVTGWHQRAGGFGGGAAGAFTQAAGERNAVITFVTVPVTEPEDRE